MDDDTRDAREYWFISEVVGIRDRLKPIAEGEIERARQHKADLGSSYDRPGKRKIRLADAANIARHAIARIDQIVREFEEDR